MKNRGLIFWSSFISVLIMITVQCNEPNSPKNSVGSGIIGTWNWTKTAGGFAYQEYVPPPAITFTIKDSNTCAFYLNDTLISERNFMVTREKLYQPDTQDIITFSSIGPDSATDYKHFPGIGQKYYKLTDSTLEIGDLGSDMFTYSYSKKK